MATKKCKLSNLGVDRMSYDDFYKNNEWKTNRSNQYYINWILKRSLIKNSIGLDVGCGTGRFTKYLITGQKTMVGVDLSSVAISKALQNNEDPRIDYICSDIIDFEYELPFDFVYIYNCSVFNSINIDHQYIKKIISLLRLGGTLIFAYSTNGSEKNIDGWKHFKSGRFDLLFNEHKDRLKLIDQFYIKIRVLSFIRIPLLALIIGKIFYDIKFVGSEYHMIFKRSQ